jgi:hypothetical protein
MDGEVIEYALFDHERRITPAGRPGGRAICPVRSV